MRDQFTITLNDLLADAERDESHSRSIGAAVERVLAGQIERAGRTEIAGPAGHSPYDDWAILEADSSLRTCLADAQKEITENRGDVLALIKLRRMICKKLHPDVVPRQFVGEAEDLMKTLNGLISSARKAP